MTRCLTICLSVCLLLIAGCSTSAHVAQAQNDSADRISVGTVQRELKIGMSSADVAMALGAPNMVTTDGQRREVWVYDKVSSEVRSSASSGFGSLVLVGGNASAGAVVRSERSLTIIVKFDQDQKVRDFAYRQSSF